MAFNRSNGLLTLLLAATASLPAQVPALPSETPAEFKVQSEAWDYTRRVERAQGRQGRADPAYAHALQRG